ncbi:uncharacterized protein V6R79_021108 [Siganus canaliculatus]
MYHRFNRRGCSERFAEGHLKLSDLKVRARRLQNQYLSKENIPDYPRPEFHVSSLKHDTDQGGLRGIKTDSGFRDPFVDGLLWWSLAVGPEEIAAAEKRLLETTYPDRTEEEVKQQSFLEKFATSPAFEKTSKYSSYRFTFPVEELLKAYSDQFCDGRPPVMRVLETVLYKQLVMYTVLVHSPEDDELFSRLPLLPDDPDAVCSYRDGRFIWRSEAMCETHSYELVLKDAEKQMEAEVAEGRHEFYVWDSVSIALHVDDQVLKFDADRLRENLTFCRDGYPLITRSQKFDDLSEAQRVVTELWPNYSAPLEG